MNTFKSVFSVTGIIALVSFSFFAIAPTAYACSCIAPGSPAEEMERSAAVFSGKVTAIESDSLGYKVKFEVERIWKGLSEESVVVSTAQDSAACGFEFTAGQEYIVYAYDAEGSLSTGLCTRTHLLVENDPDVSSLGEGMAPVSGESPNEAAENSPVRAIGLVIGVLVLLGIVYKVATSARRPS